MMEKIQITDSSVAAALNTSLPLASNSRNGLMPSLFYKMSTKRYPASSEVGYKVIASCRMITTGIILLTSGVQGISIATAIIGIASDAVNIRFFNNELLSILPDIYYKRLDDLSILIAVKDRGPWMHYDVTSFSQCINAEIYKIDSLDGFTKVTIS